MIVVVRGRGVICELLSRLGGDLGGEIHGGEDGRVVCALAGAERSCRGLQADTAVWMGAQVTRSCSAIVEGSDG